MAAESVGSDKGELKRMIKRASSGDPVHMAFAMGKDGKAVIKVDKMKQPKALEKLLKDGMPDAKNLRFGTIEIDPDDEKVVRFVVNKAVGGAAGKLAVALKGTGYSKIQIVLDDGSSVEEAQGEDEDGDAGGDADAVAAKSAAGDSDDAGDGAESGADASASSNTDSGTGDAGAGADSADSAAQSGLDATPEVGAEAAGADAATATATPNAATLTSQLTGLVKQMLGVIQKDPSQKAMLAQLATDAQASLKRGDLDQTAAALEILREAITVSGQGSAGANGAAPAAADAAGPANGGAPPAPPVPGNVATPQADGGTPAPPAAGAGASADPAATQKLHKSRAAWAATRAKVQSDLDNLNKAVMDATDGEDSGADLAASFKSAVQPVMDTLGDELSDLLGRAAQADDSERPKLMAQARETIASHLQYVQSNPVISHLDDNPFVKLSIGKLLSGTLNTLSAIVK